jgi:CRISPR/Cas system-associated exonuclease Cas4 (RecB family)
MVERVYGKENELGEWVKPVPKEGDEYTYQWNAEWVDDTSKPILKITKSSLGTYKWCKKQYEFSYLDRRPIDRTEPMIKGIFIHDSVEDFWKVVDIKKAENMSFLEIKDYFTSLFPISDYTELSDTIAMFQAQRFDKSRESGILGEFLPVGNELQLDARILIPQFTHPKYPLNRDYVVHIQGIIDRVFKEGNNYIPMELKTGPWKDARKTGIRRELAFYKMLMENSNDCEMTPITHWGWYYPASNYICVEPVKKQTMNAMLKSIAEMIYSYELNEFQPSFFHKKCVHCSFMDICPAAIAASETGSDWL